MPIIRTYACPECHYYVEVTLAPEQWDAPPPDCPRCNAWDLPQGMQQEFKPFAIGGSPRARAVALAEDIAANDYQVADMRADDREGGTPKVRYRELKPDALPGVTAQSMRDAAKAVASAPPGPPSRWGGVSHEAMQTALALGRETRVKHGNGLDVLQGMLKSGQQVDLIEASKRRSMRVW